MRCAMRARRRMGRDGARSVLERPSETITALQRRDTLSPACSCDEITRDWHALAMRSREIGMLLR